MYYIYIYIRIIWIYVKGEFSSILYIQQKCSSFQYFPPERDLLLKYFLSGLSPVVITHLLPIDYPDCSG